MARSWILHFWPVVIRRKQVNRIRSMSARPFLQASLQLKVCPRPNPVAKRDAQAMAPHLYDPQAGIIARVGDIALRKPGNAIYAPRQFAPRGECPHDPRP